MPKSLRKITSSKDFPFDASVGYQIRVAHRMIQRSRQVVIEPYGISSGMWFFLRILWQEDGLTQRELARRVGLMEPTALMALRAMKRAGLIRRSRNGTDKRKVNVFLTPKGRDLEKKLIPLVMGSTAVALTGFSSVEVKRLLGMLARIQKNLSKAKSTDAET